MVISVVGSRAGLRVVLDAKHRLMAMLKRRNGAVVEIEMGDLNPPRRLGSPVRCATLLDGPML